MNIELPGEEQLLMPRQKPRSVFISVSYRIKSLAALIFGKKRAARFFLTAAWLFWRLAFELSGELYNDDFFLQAKGMSEDFLRRWISAIPAIPGIPAKGSVIDIGCNNGRWCRIAAKYADTVMGIDFDEGVIRQAREQTTEKNIEYVVGDATKDLGERYFDIAIVIHVLEHIEDSDRFLRELQNITAKAIIEVPDFESDPLNWVRWKVKTPFYSDADHIREYTEDILISQLERAGWNVLETKKHGAALLVVAEHQNRPERQNQKED